MVGGCNEFLYILNLKSAKKQLIILQNIIFVASIHNIRFKDNIDRKEHSIGELVTYPTMLCYCNNALTTHLGT